MTATYWQIGRSIVEFEHEGQERAEYGEAVIKQLAKNLEPQFGRGFGWRNLMQMRAFFLTWSAKKILQTPSAKSVPLGHCIKPHEARAFDKETNEVNLPNCFLLLLLLFHH
jgi:hypothetical protein